MRINNISILILGTGPEKPKSDQKCGHCGRCTAVPDFLQRPSNRTVHRQVLTVLFPVFVFYPQRRLLDIVFVSEVPSLRMFALSDLIWLVTWYILVTWRLHTSSLICALLSPSSHAIHLRPNDDVKCVYLSSLLLLLFVRILESYNKIDMYLHYII